MEGSGAASALGTGAISVSLSCWPSPLACLPRPLATPLPPKHPSSCSQNSCVEETAKTWGLCRGKFSVPARMPEQAGLGRREQGQWLPSLLQFASRPVRAAAHQLWGGQEGHQYCSSRSSHHNLCFSHHCRAGNSPCLTPFLAFPSFRKGAEGRSTFR